MPKAKKQEIKEKEEQVPVVETVKEETTETQAPKEKASKKKTSESKEVETKSTKKPTTMEELLEMTGHQIHAPKKGTVVEGLVTDVSRKMVTVDIGGKTEGIVV